MPVTVDLPPGTLRRLEAEAARRGVGIEVVIAELADMLPAAEQPKGRRRLAFVGVGASAKGISDRIDEILADGFGRD